VGVLKRIGVSCRELLLVLMFWMPVVAGRWSLGQPTVRVPDMSGWISQWNE